MHLEGNQIYAYEATFCAVMTMVVYARLFVRIYPRGSVFSRHAWRWSDIFIFVSWCMRITITVSDAWMVSWNVYNLDPSVYTADNERIKIQKVEFWETIFYSLTFVMIKCAMLCLFAEFVPRTFKKVWIFIRIIGVIVVVHGLVWTITQLAWCRPISSNWDGPTPTCRVPIGVRIFWFSGHVFTEVLLISIPLTILHLLRNLDLPQKIVGTIMCSLGLITITCAVANTAISVMFFRGPPSHELMIAHHYIAMTEPPTAICVACVPPLRLLFTRSGRARLWRERTEFTTKGATDNDTVTATASAFEKDKMDGGSDHNAGFSPSESSNRGSVEPRGGMGVEDHEAQLYPRYPDVPQIGQKIMDVRTYEHLKI